MSEDKRWRLAKDEEAETLRQARPRGRRSLLRSTVVTLLVTGPLVACNQKGGLNLPDTDDVVDTDQAGDTDDTDNPGDTDDDTDG